MLQGAFAVVEEVLPERQGVNVRFRDLVPSGSLDGHFVRVLARRSHPDGGCSQDLPEKGELGLVLGVGAAMVWVGSLPWQDETLHSPDPAIAYWTNRAGVTLQALADGSVEALHPSGLRLTVSKDGAPLPALSKRGRPRKAAAAPSPHLRLEHPAGPALEILPDGGVVLSFAGGGSLQVGADGRASVSGLAGLALLGDSARFLMEPALEWLKTHTHSGVQTGGGASGPPALPPPADALSVSKLKGGAGA